MQFRKRNRISPAQTVIFGFLALIVCGALILALPLSSRSGQATPFFDALFTATSATCVTGLVVYDTYTHWSWFGQGVILVLIQAGGMGVVTMAIAASLFTHRRIGLRQRFVMQESISAPQVGGIVRLTGFILKTTVCWEAAGVLVLAVRFCPTMGWEGVWYAVFHSISAFCNAGFDLMGAEEPFSSLTAYVNDPIVNVTVMLLVVVGGLGFSVWSDFQKNRLRFRAYRLQSNIVLTTTAILLVLPALYLLVCEFGRPQWDGLSWEARIGAAVFQSVTTRTAGFNTVELVVLQQPSLLVMIALMLIGGSPGSTAGGFKTTALATVYLAIRAAFEKTDNAQAFGRRLPAETLRNAVTIIALYLTSFLAGAVFINFVDGVPLSAALFECASAVGTVGLSLGVTPALSRLSQTVLMLLMYLGRVGGLTMIYALANGHVPAPSQPPQEKITIG